MIWKKLLDNVKHYLNINKHKIKYKAKTIKQLTIDDKIYTVIINRTYNYPTRILLCSTQEFLDLSVQTYTIIDTLYYKRRRELNLHVENDDTKRDTLIKLIGKNKYMNVKQVKIENSYKISFITTEIKSLINYIEEKRTQTLNLIYDHHKNHTTTRNPQLQLITLETNVKLVKSHYNTLKQQINKLPTFI